jgi:uncharacterized tellurite resistance protein B-like protein
MPKDSIDGGVTLFGPEEEEKRKPFHEGMHIPGVGWVPRIISREKSLYAILLAAAFIDRTVDRREMEEIRALAARTKTLRRLPPDQLHTLQEKIEPKLDAKMIDKYAELATRHLRGAKSTVRDSAFMHALDILFADQMLTDTEREFIKRLARMLRIDPQHAREYIDVMMTKNAH